MQISSPLLRGISALALLTLAACLEVGTEMVLGDPDPKAADYVGTWVIHPDTENSAHMAVTLVDAATGELSALGARSEPSTIYVRLIGAQRIVMMNEDLEGTDFSIGLVKKFEGDDLVISYADEQKFKDAVAAGNITVSNPTWDADGKHPMITAVAAGFDIGPIFVSDESIVRRISPTPMSAEQLNDADPVTADETSEETPQ